ncbi:MULTISPECIES: YVTN family beta-propeller repeat protein [Bacillus]|uniref:YVTN family beta-propeller repeat protein n=1 Tax=Bacillus TaxID=1386 RepID=UPI000BB90265|nr:MULTISPECIES: YncE family protein [Bacillus]
MKKCIITGLILLLSLFLAACGGAVNSIESPSLSRSTEVDQKQEIKESIFFYTADEGGISKVDALTNKLVETIKIDGSVHNVQISPNNKMIGGVVVPLDSHGDHDESDDSHKHDEYETSHESNGKAVFYDAYTSQLIREVEVGSHPAHIVFTEDSKYAVVSNDGDNNVSVIDLSSYEVIGTITTGNGPHGFRIAKDSQTVYIANMGEDTVSVLDLNSMDELKRIKVGTTPVTTAVTSDGELLLVTLNTENALAIVDLSDDSVEEIAVGEGPAQVYIQSDDKYAFVANQGTAKNPSNTVTKIDLATREVVATIEVGKGSHGVVTSDDNKFVYVTNMYENTVSVINNDNNQVVATVKVGKVPNGITVQSITK